MSRKQDEIILSPSTLRVYIFLLENFKDKITVKELQRGLNFLSSSSSHFHLQKLVELGILEEQRGVYYITKNKRKVEFLRNFVFLKRKLIPKDIFYLLIIFIINVITLNYFISKGMDLFDFLILLVPTIFSVFFFTKNAVELLNMKKRILSGKTRGK